MPTRDSWISFALKFLLSAILSVVDCPPLRVYNEESEELLVFMFAGDFTR